MSSLFSISVQWKNPSMDFSYETFIRKHTIGFSGNQILNNSSAPDFFVNVDTANPEELLVSALASCHMLTFLAIASKSGYVVGSYTDQAEAILDKNEEGKLAVTIINLNPIVLFSGDKQPDVEKLKSLHEKAHRNCFIANSIKTKVNIL
mgnify:CR=1 FL=1